MALSDRDLYEGGSRNRIRVSNRKRSNIEKQEALVSELWDFARDAQKPVKVGCVIKSRDVELEDAAIRKTLIRIMEIFGYVVLEVQ